MGIDWNFLNKQTESFRTLNIGYDADGKTVLDTTFSGLQLRLSELARLAPSSGGSTMAVWTDTLIVDYPSFDWEANIVVARRIDVSMLQGSPMPIRVPPKGKNSVCEFLLGESEGGAPFQLTTTANQAGTSEFTVPVSVDPLQVVYFIAEPDGSSKNQITGKPGEIRDLLCRPWALNSLQSSFTAASWLMDSTDPKDIDTAKSMLNWVVSSIRALGPANDRLSAEFVELYGQAASLLVTLNVSSGAKYVPVLSADYYTTQAGKLLDALQVYEGNLKILQVQDDIKNAIAQVSATLAGVAQDEETPLQVDFDNLSESIKNLTESVNKLQLQFDLQNIEATTRFMLLKNALANMQITQFLEACFKFAIDVVKLGAAIGGMVATGGASGAAGGAAGAGEGAAGGGAEGAGSILEPLAGLLQNGFDMVSAATKSYPDSPLPGQAKTLMQVQSQLMTSFVSSAALWNAAQSGKLAQLPQSLGAVAIDPGLAWDNYMIEAENALSNMSLLIGSGSGSGEAQAAANDYLASLKILAQYGKAINAKFVVYTEQLARAIVVKAQIAAAKNVQARWQELQASAKTDQEKLAALKGMIKKRTDAITRSIFVAWRNYRNAYYYMFFKAPSAAIRLDMNAAQLKDAFANVSLGAAGLLGDVPDSQKVRLPQENVAISFSFDIVRQGVQTGANDAAALLTPASNGVPASINWCIPIGDRQLKGVLPNGGNVAIWISKAEFWIEGVTANAKGKVIVDVATSGSYVNGYGPANAKEFVNKGMQANFAYDQASSQAYIHWQIPQAVYMTPTPFTQWSMQFDKDGGDPGRATKLRMDLTIAYRAQS
jgi:hypothetical protein